MRRTRCLGAGWLILHALLFAFSLPGCASVDVLRLTGETFAPKTSVSDVEVLEHEPTRPHVQIAELSVDSFWLSVASKRQKILEKAATLGADAVVFSEPEVPTLPQSTQGIGQSRPPNQSVSKDDTELMPDVVSSIPHDPILGGDVKILLIRGGGGGHGGGHAGGHGGGGHWGGMRGRSGPSAARPWGRYYSPYYGPRYWGYGLYGPGGWGYAPYWGGYDPFWGAYGSYPGWAYPGSGPLFMNTVTVGQAIRYTDSP